jgi:hypothetical protein
MTLKNKGEVLWVMFTFDSIISVAWNSVWREEPKSKQKNSDSREGCQSEQMCKGVYVIYVH